MAVERTEPNSDKRIIRPVDGEPLQLGQTLGESTIKSGLQELNSLITFDHLANHGERHPYRGVRQGVFYNAGHICSMDRGVIPEFMVWSQTIGHVPIDMADIEKFSDTKVCWMEVKPTDERFNYAVTQAEKKDDQYQIGESGKVFFLEAFRFTMVKDGIMRAGWRHVFESLIRARVPRMDRSTIGKKFSVDMYKYIGKQVPEVVTSRF